MALVLLYQFVRVQNAEERQDASHMTIRIDIAILLPSLICAANMLVGASGLYLPPRACSSFQPLIHRRASHFSAVFEIWTT